MDLRTAKRSWEAEMGGSHGQLWEKWEAKQEGEREPTCAEVSDLHLGPVAHVYLHSQAQWKLGGLRETSSSDTEHTQYEQGSRFYPK